MFNHLEPSVLNVQRFSQGYQVLIHSEAKGRLMLNPENFKSYGLCETFNFMIMFYFHTAFSIASLLNFSILD